MESLKWSDKPFKIVRSITHMKPYLGAVNFTKLKRKVDPNEFKSKHQFELIEEEELVDERQLSNSLQQNLDSEERIRLPSGHWIFRDVLTGRSRRSNELEEEDQERIPPERSIESPTTEENQEQAREQTSLERILSEGDHCASRYCDRPTGDQATYIPCMHCTKRFHIKCVGFSLECAQNENLICFECDP